MNAQKGNVVSLQVVRKTLGNHVERRLGRTVAVAVAVRSWLLRIARLPTLRVNFGSGQVLVNVLFMTKFADPDHREG